MAINERLSQLCAAESSDTTECRKLVDSIQMVDGDPSRVILDAAEDCGADLIVMGAHRHAAVGEIIMGSTARRALHSAHLTVLVVKIPRGYSERLYPPQERTLFSPPLRLHEIRFQKQEMNFIR